MAQEQDLYDAFASMGGRILPSAKEQAELERELARQYREHARREVAFQAAYPDGFDRLSDEIEAMKRFGLYCGQCGHGNGCVHGIPASRV